MTTTINPTDSMVSSPEPVTTRRGCRSFGGWHIAAIVAAFILFWPLGLAMLAWALWRDQIKAWPIVQKMFGSYENRSPRTSHRPGFMARRPSNTALAQYLEREQERLKSEQEKLAELVKAFESFKDAEHRTADQRDFETFLQQRADDEKAD